MKKLIKIIFIGSNFFSLYFLKFLYSRRYNIIGIVTNPDTYSKKYRNKNLLKKYALKKNIPFLQPENLLDFFF